MWAIYNNPPTGPFPRFGCRWRIELPYSLALIAPLKGQRRRGFGVMAGTLYRVARRHKVPAITPNISAPRPSEGRGRG